MNNLIKQSTGRGRLTKIKGFILASLTVGVMALPFSVPAQITSFNSTGTITDGSPTSWTLSVEFPIVIVNHIHMFSVGFYDDQNVIVSTPPPDFQPFYINVTSGTNNQVFVSFDSGGSIGFFVSPDISTLSTTVPTPFIYSGGSIDTIQGFVYPASVTVILTKHKTYIVEVTFSNDPFLSAKRLIDTLGGQTANTLQKALNLVQRKIKHGKFLAACNDLATFVDDVNTQSSAGNITSDEQAQLLNLAGAIKPLIPGC